MTNSEAGSERNTHECQIHSLSSIAFKLLRIYRWESKCLYILRGELQNTQEFQSFHFKI